MLEYLLSVASISILLRDMKISLILTDRDGNVDNVPPAASLVNLKSGYHLRGIEHAALRDAHRVRTPKLWKLVLLPNSDYAEETDMRLGL